MTVDSSTRSDPPEVQRGKTATSVAAGRVHVGVGTWFLVGTWFALVFGLIEVAVLAVLYEGFHELINRGIQYVWMTPVSYFLLMTVTAATVALVGRFWKRAARLEFGVFPFLVVGVTSVAIPIGHNRLHVIAGALLVLGVAAQLRRSISRRGVRFLQLVHRSVLWLAATVLVLGLGVNGWNAFAERRAVLALPTSPNSVPNILLIILDTVRSANLSLYGYERSTTPNIARLAADGVVFERAITPSPWTLPAHASMFTGRLPHELSADWEVPLDDEYPTVAEVLAGEGYLTGGFVANRDFGTYQHGLNRGFIRYEDYGVSIDEVLLSSSLSRWICETQSLRLLVGTDRRMGLKKAEDVVDSFLAWQADHAERPFFAFINLYDAHDPYLPPDPYYNMFGPHRDNRLSALRRRDQDEPLTDTEVESEMAAYDGAIRYMDDQIGRLMNELETRGVGENTIVIIASDHGEEFGEHGLFLHGHSLYVNQLWVPLLMHFPGQVTGHKRVKQPVSLRDLGLTILELANVTPGQTFEGTSLARHWGGTAADSVQSGPVVSEVRRIVGGPSDYPAAHGDMESWVLGNLHYIRYPNAVVDVYDWSTDPTEQSPKCLWC
jgi:arylsulfatase A-like enzyme